MLCIGTPNWISFDFALCSCRVLALLIDMITSKGKEHSHLFQSTLNPKSNTNGYDQKGQVTSWTGISVLQMRCMVYQWHLTYAKWDCREKSNSNYR